MHDPRLPSKDRYSGGGSSRRSDYPGKRSDERYEREETPEERIKRKARELETPAERRERKARELLEGQKKEGALEFDLDVEEATLDPAVLKKLERELRGEVFGHPGTLVPFLVGGVSLAYWIVPIVGGAMIALPIGIGAFVLAAGNVWFRLMHVGEKYEGKVAKLEEEFAKKLQVEKQAKIDRSVKFLEREFGRLNAREASRAREELGQLVQAFSEFDREIAAHQAGKFQGGMSGRVPALAKDAYKQGLRVLACVFELLREDPSLDRTALQREIGELERDLEACRLEGGERTQRSIQRIEKALALRKQRLEKADWRDESVKDLIYQSDACEEVLRSTREDLIKLRMEYSEEALQAITRKLQGCVSTLVEVQELVKRSESLSV